jgi:hypothetical protein
MVDIFYYADLYALGLLFVLETVFVIHLVRGGVRGRRLASAWAYFFGTFITVSMSFHVAENIWRIIPNTPVTDAVKPEYNFRFYALILFGTLMIIQGARLMKAARGFAFGGEKACFSLSLRRHTLVVLALVVPLIPIQIFASMMTIFGLFNLAAIALVRRKTASDDERVLSVDALLEPKRLCLKINKTA